MNSLVRTCCRSIYYVSCFILYASILPQNTIAALDNDFARYDIILQRKPFGNPPPAPVAPAASVKQAPKEPPFAREFTLCAMTEHDDGTLTIGLVRRGPDNKTDSFVLAPGEAAGEGIVFEQADYHAKSIILAKGEERYRIKMEGGFEELSAGGETGAVAEVVAAAPGPAAATDGMSTSRELYFKRLREQAEAEKKAVAEAAARQREEFRKMSKEQVDQYQLEAIRNGRPPLPIPLSPEVDAILVKEGLLPPAE